MTSTLLDADESAFVSSTRLTLIVALEGTVHCRIGEYEVQLAAGEAALATLGGVTVLVVTDPAQCSRALHVGYDVRGSIANRVVDPLPDLARVPAAPGGCPTLGMIEAELRSDIPGRAAVLDLLNELLLVSTLREWFALPDSPTPTWYAAHTDPVVGQTLKRIHDRPGEPWTVDSLARAAGVSRATLASRFTQLMSQPLMAYLTDWRLCCARDLLTTSDLSVESIAARVGYSSASAVSAAFTNAYGVRPGAHRRAHRRLPDEDAMGTNFRSARHRMPLRTDGLPAPNELRQ
ncbi:AraC family transcriptional regulator [Nocardia cyriacigeorgica]|uniref:AraC family transcriptional regulator n=1 Tax=Nocardia cyriacigeorgica TaxID=135487 RepID=A0A6P1D5I0_9NOCA|nr:AraC family transcriptional regulator [Nocardia cyriacigeorgica]NEW55392.1 AraC family transcriptional regulator [Nocardia cyriacigeorgica]